MDISKALKVSAAGMKAQGVRLHVLAENIAKVSMAEQKGTTSAV